MSFSDRRRAILERIEKACDAAGRDPADVQLLAVSKTREVQEILDAANDGQVAFGENRVQELTAKATEIGDRVPEWHFIGSLQTNKVRALVGVDRLTMLHSVDRPKLVERLQGALVEHHRRLGVLIEVHATDEETKQGAHPDEVSDLARMVAEADRLELRGLMAMGPREGDAAPVFARVAELRERIQDELGKSLPVLSLGMTGDLEEAVAAGSTLLRVGTGLFGPRRPRQAFE